MHVHVKWDETKVKACNLPFKLILTKHLHFWELKRYACTCEMG